MKLVLQVPRVQLEQTVQLALKEKQVPRVKRVRRVIQAKMVEED